MSIVESAVIAKQLNEVAVGKTIKSAIVNQNPHGFVWFALEPQYAFAPREVSAQQAEGYEELLVGRQIAKSEVDGLSNYLYIGNRRLSFVLPTRYYKSGEKLPKRHQLLLTLDDGSSIALCGSLGGPVFLFEYNGEDNSGAFPSILSDEFSLDFYMNIVKNMEFREFTAKYFLATKGRFPGIDNYILHELLWEAQVNPKSKLKFIEENDFIRMYNAIKKVIPTAIKAGGLDTQKDIYGNLGGYKTKASKNTLGCACERCKGTIIKESFLGGVVYYCPECQPLHNGK